MDLNFEISEKLRTGTVVFKENHGKICANSRRAMGVEIEFGCSWGEDLQVNKHWTLNGGMMHVDCGFQNGSLEIATPEVSNPIQAVAYSKASYENVVATFRKSNPEIIWYTRNCWHPQDRPDVVVSGNHESYTINDRIRDPNKLLELAPYFASRQLISGMGCVGKEGNYQLSQRASVIEQLIGEGTTQNRSLICTRELAPIDPDGDKENCAAESRFHLICGEANMDETALFLKFVLTSFVLELHEMGQLPNLDFDDSQIIDNLHDLSYSSLRWFEEGVAETDSCWRMSSIKHKGITLSAVEVLLMCVERAKKSFKGRDLMTDIALVMLEDKISKLLKPRENIEDLGRSFDWATKFILLNRHINSGGGFDTEEKIWELRNLDLEYHTVGENGLHRYLEVKNWVEVLLPWEMIENAEINPPKDTRASFRGYLVGRLRSQNADILRKVKVSMSDPGTWNSIELKRFYQRDRVSDSKIFPLLNPLESHEKLRGEVEEWFSRYCY